MIRPLALLLMLGTALLPSSARGRPVRDPARGLLYYAKADRAGSDKNTAAIANPCIAGALFQVVWSEVESSDGQCDWSVLDRRMQPWWDAGKPTAVRFLWSTSGYWPMPAYKTPTPGWVWEQGAAFIRHEPSGTEIPLAWDPIYQKYAWRFMEQFAARYGDNPRLLFVDITPGAETNPYRFGTLQQRDPGFADVFRHTRASDGRAYDNNLWLDTVKQWVDAANRILPSTPLLVTLNVGGLDSRDRSIPIGDYCVEKNFLVGQNGLTGQSFHNTNRGRAGAFVRWSEKTRLFFEMAHASGESTGTLMEVMRAGERIGADYVNVYPEDVLRGTPGQPGFDPACAEALRYGRDLLSRPRPMRSP